jgi:hypothetical protein
MYSDVLRCCSVTCLFVCKRVCAYVDSVLLAAVFVLYMRSCPVKCTHECIYRAQ